MRLPRFISKQHIYLLKVGESIKLVLTLDHLKIINSILFVLFITFLLHGDTTYNIINKIDYISSQHIL